MLTKLHPQQTCTGERQDSEDEVIDVLFLGDKSEVLDIDNPDEDRFPLFKRATRHECVLEAGDVLFIPALWFHNVSNEEWGVSVNVFWRHLPSNHYDSRDVYGNRDLVDFAKAEQAVDRAVNHLKNLPPDYRDFYARRLVQKLERKLYNDTS